MSRILGVNGILSNGSGSTDLLLADLKERGHLVHDVKLPWTTALLARFRWWQHRDAHRLVAAHAHGDNVIAHSYGGLRVLRAMQLGARFRLVFLFAPAMEVDVEFPIGAAERIFVIYDRHDRAIGLGARLRKHDFGAMGRCGYSGAVDRRVINVPADPHPDAHGPLLHGHYFRDENRARWVQFICERIHGTRLAKCLVAESPGA